MLIKILVTLFIVAFISGCNTDGLDLDITDSVPADLKPFVKSAAYTFKPSLDDDVRQVSLELNNGVTLNINLNNFQNTLDMREISSESYSTMLNQSISSDPNGSALASMMLINLITQVFPIIAPPPSTSCQP